MHKLNIQPLGDAAVRIAFGREISEEVHGDVRMFCALLEKNPVPGIIEWVPAYAAVTVYYDPWYVSYEKVQKHIAALWEKKETVSLPEGTTWLIPVCYGDEYGPDLHDASAHTGMEVEEIVKKHAKPAYTVYMIGFTPGFPYLGGMDPSLAVPRLKQPRTSVPAGSVGIAGEQTGVYSLKSPGGWRIIGRTPVKLYDRLSETPVFLQAGDKIRFESINTEQFAEIEKEVEAGSYQVKQEGE